MRLNSTYILSRGDRGSESVSVSMQEHVVVGDICKAALMCQNTLERLQQGRKDRANLLIPASLKRSDNELPETSTARHNAPAFDKTISETPTCASGRKFLSLHPPRQTKWRFIGRVRRSSSSGGGAGDNTGCPPTPPPDNTELSPACEITKVSSAQEKCCLTSYLWTDMEHGKWFTDCLLLSRLTHTEWCIPSPYFFFFLHISKSVSKNCFWNERGMF